MSNIQTQELIIVLFFMFGETPPKPLCVKHIMNKLPILRWLFLLLLLFNRGEGLNFFIVVMFFYILLYVIDYSML